MKRKPLQFKPMKEVLTGCNVQEMHTLQPVLHPMTEKTSVVQPMESRPTVAFSATVEEAVQ